DLADGTYAVRTGNNRLLGGFTVLGGTVSSTSGAVSAIPGGVSFDVARLAPVALSPAALSSTGTLVATGIDGAVATASAYTYYLPDGDYGVSDLAARSYGTFTVSAGALSSTTGALLIAAPGALAFDLGQLATAT